MKYRPNEYSHNNLVSSSFLAVTKDSISWNFTTTIFSDISYCNDIKTLKDEIRKLFFNHYLFSENDSLKDNYFWKRFFNEKQ